MYYPFYAILTLISQIYPLKNNKKQTRVNLTLTKLAANEFESNRVNFEISTQSHPLRPLNSCDSIFFVYLSKNYHAKKVFDFFPSRFFRFSAHALICDIQKWILNVSLKKNGKFE